MREYRLLAVLLLGGMSILVQPASAAGKKFFAYNMTTRTDFTGVYLAPAGTTNWGPNQALNDPDKSLDPTERLTLTNLEASHYDLKLVARDGHTCIIKDVDLTQKTSFEIKQAQLTDCH